MIPSVSIHVCVQRAIGYCPKCPQFNHKPAYNGQIRLSFLSATLSAQLIVGERRSVTKSGSETTAKGQASALSVMLEKYRLPLSKFFVGLILVLMVFTASRWHLSSTATWALDSIALVLLLIACLGRVWCIMYIGGQKNTSVVAAGPYSMVRNPLYVFSFIGALGLVLMTHSIIIAALLLIFFVGIYPFVVAKEEANLHGLFGSSYDDYCAKTPRFVPSLKLYSTDSAVPADIRRMEKSLFDSGCFVLAFIALTGIRLAHETGLIPVLFQLP